MYTNLAIESAFPPATISTRLTQNGNTFPDLERYLVSFHRRVVVLSFTVTKHLWIRRRSQNCCNHINKITVK